MLVCGVTMSTSKINQMIKQLTLLLCIGMTYWGCDFHPWNSQWIEGEDGLLYVQK